jgi:hypothetical protein
VRACIWSAPEATLKHAADTPVMSTGNVSVSAPHPDQHKILQNVGWDHACSTILSAASLRDVPVSQLEMRTCTSAFANAPRCGASFSVWSGCVSIHTVNAPCKWRHVLLLHTVANKRNANLARMGMPACMEPDGTDHNITTRSHHSGHTTLVTPLWSHHSGHTTLVRAEPFREVHTLLLKMS